MPQNDITSIWVLSFSLSFYSIFMNFCYENETTIIELNFTEINKLLELDIITNVLMYAKLMILQQFRYN